MVGINGATVTTPDRQRKLWSHEQRHILNDALNFHEDFSSKALLKLLHKYQARAADKFLAYLTGGTHPRRALALLSESRSEGGLYDYIEEGFSNSDALWYFKTHVETDASNHDLKEKYRPRTYRRM